MIIWFWVLAFAKSKTIFLFVICGVSLVSIYDDKKVSRRIYRHSSTEFPFELAHENSPANFMREFHWHDFLEITYVNAGEGTYYIEDKIIPVKAGDFLVINNIERHRVTFNAKNPLYETVFHFDSEMLDNVLISTFNIFNYNSTMFFNKLTPSPENRKNLESIVSVIVDEFKRKEPCYELCIISQLLIVVLILLPIIRKRKKYVIHVVIYYFSRFILKTGVAIKVVKQNPMNETYRKPALIIANHQSFLDILLLLSTTPKIVMLTKDWVWNSPFFGFIVRYADFHSSDEGYETLTRNLKECMDAGYSVVIFPEGTRSVDCSIQRFHKGAFYLAQQLQADILPMIIYGAGLVTSKRQGFYI